MYLYKSNYYEIDSTDIIKHLSFIANQRNFEIDFLNNINTKKGQDLFGYLLSVTPSLIFSKINNTKSKDIKSEDLIDNSNLLRLINIRIDFLLLKEHLLRLHENDDTVKVDEENMTMELIHFIHKYVFIKLNDNIFTFELNNKKETFNILKNQRLNEKYSSNQKHQQADRIEAQRNFITNYTNSFENLKDKNEIESDLLFMLKETNQMKLLWSIIEKNIFFKDDLSSTRKNRLLIYFFKNIVSRIFYTQLNSNSIEDFEVKDKFRFFLKKVQK